MSQMSQMSYICQMSCQTDIFKNCKNVKFTEGIPITGDLVGKQGEMWNQVDKAPQVSDRYFKDECKATLNVFPGRKDCISEDPEGRKYVTTKPEVSFTLTFVGTSTFR